VYGAQEKVNKEESDLESTAAWGMVISSWLHLTASKSCQASIQCKGVAVTQKEHMRAVFKTSAHGWKARLHKGASGWELKTLKLTRLGI